MTMPNAMRRQDVVAKNVGLMVKARGLKKKDLAQAMGISPQAVSTRLQGTANWTLDEACAAADFLRVPLDTLLRASLTAGEVLGYEKTAAPDDSGNGGQLVAGHGFEPWTSGYPRGPRSKPMPRLILSLAA